MTAHRPTLALLVLAAMPLASAGLVYAIDCPPHEDHCALKLVLRAAVVARADITQDPVGVEAGANATIRVRVEAIEAGADGNLSGTVGVNVTSIPGVTVLSPALQLANVTVGGPAEELAFPVSLAPGLTAGQVLFVPLHAFQERAVESTHVPLQVIAPLESGAAIGDVVTHPALVAPLAAALGATLAWLRFRPRE